MGTATVMVMDSNTSFFFIFHILFIPESFLYLLIFNTPKDVIQLKVWLTCGKSNVFSFT